MELAKEGFAVVNFSYRLAPEYKFPAPLYMGICTNPKYAGEYDFKVLTGARPKAAALNCGVYDFYKELNNKESNISGLAEEIFVEETREEQLKLFQPVTVVTKEFPPIFLMTCEYDFLAEQASFMKKALEKAGVYHEYHLYGKGQKEIGHVFHCNIRLEEAKKCNKEECEFFKRFL